MAPSGPRVPVESTPTSPRAPTNTVNDNVPLPATKKKSVDDELAEHLKIAEEHLIAAVELFTNPGRPSRETGYRSRLIMAQETITSLYRAELVRIRGPQRPERKKK